MTDLTAITKRSAVIISTPQWCRAVTVSKKAHLMMARRMQQMGGCGIVARIFAQVSPCL
ncbi:MAG: hypothetical protein ACOH2H_13165 [Cypionkella sp.]